MIKIVISPIVPKYHIIKEMRSRDITILIVLATVVYMIVTFFANNNNSVWWTSAYCIKAPSYTNNCLKLKYPLHIFVSYAQAAT